jgi:hypothetical protein
VEVTKATNGPPRRKLSVGEIVAAISISLTIAGLWLARERALWNFADVVHRLDTSVTNLSASVTDTGNRVSVLSYKLGNLETGFANMGMDDKGQWEAIRQLNERLIQTEWRMRREQQQGNP